jgi:hypothetical protein
MSRYIRAKARIDPRIQVALARPLWGGLLGAILLFAGTATAHPHAWIDLRVSLLFDDQGQLHALRQEWAFDPTYSHLLLEDMDASEPGLDMDTALQKMAVRMLENLHEYDYFTEIRRNEQQLDTTEALDGNCSGASAGCTFASNCRWRRFARTGHSRYSTASTIRVTGLRYCTIRVT